MERALKPVVKLGQGGRRSAVSSCRFTGVTAGSSAFTILRVLLLLEMFFLFALLRLLSVYDNKRLHGRHLLIRILRSCLNIFPPLFSFYLSSQIK